MNHHLIKWLLIILALSFGHADARNLSLSRGGQAGLQVPIQIKSVGIAAPYGFSSDGSTWHSGYATWALAMPSALKSAIVTAGFNTVRVYVDPLPLFLAANDAAIDTLLTNGPLVAVADLTAAGLEVIVDFHIQKSPSSVAGWGASDVIAITSTSDTKFARLVHCGVKMAQALIPYGRNVIFGMFNEWPVTSTFTGVSQATQLAFYYDAIRAAAPSLALTVSGADFADTGTFVTLPFDPSHFDDNTYVAIHDYNPIAFSFQDSTVAGYFQYINRLKFDPGTGGQTLSSELANATAFVNADTGLSSGTKTAYINSINTQLTAYFGAPENTAWLQARFQSAANWADAHGVMRKRLFIEEFGSVGDPSADNPRTYISPPSGGHGGDATSRANYYSAVASKATALGVSWSVHSLEADFFEITDGTQVLVPTIISALFPGGGGTCPRGTGFNDGCQLATTGTPQNIHLLDSYGANRRPENVAGVDYRVGPDTGALSDASTAFPACATFTNNDFAGGNRLTVNSAPCTIDHLDFSLHGSICLTIAANTGGTVTVTNNKFTEGTNCHVGGDALVELSGTAPVNFQYNFMDTNYDIGFATSVDSLIKQLPGAAGVTVDISYNEFANISSHPLQFNFNITASIHNNFMHGLGAGGAHADYFILNTIPASLTQVINQTWDTIYVDPTSCTMPDCTSHGGGGGAICYMAPNAGDNLSGKCSFNTYIAVSGTQQSYSVRSDQNLTTSPQGPFEYKNNYIDWSGGFGEIENSCSPGTGRPCSGVGVTCTGNKNLVTGATITSVFGSAPYFQCS